jgi:hypothetical protein
MTAGVLVGRRLATSGLRSAVDAAISGDGGVILLAGEAGMGKTALAAEAAAYAKARGAAAVWGACWEGEGTPGYWPWIQVVRELARDGGEGDAVLAGLAGEYGAHGGILGDDAAVRFRTYDMTAAYVRQRAAAAPLVLVLDDLHWADASSLRLLLFLARQLHGSAVLVIGTYRDAELTSQDHPARGLLAELAGQAELLYLAGLAVSEVGQLLAEVCGGPVPAELTAAVHQRTGGNPFFVQQVARLLAARGTPLDYEPVAGVPPAVGDVLARRLARLPEAVVDLLGIAAVAGRQFTVAAIAAVAGLPAGDAVPLVDTAARAGIVEHDLPEGARFAHDLFREVLYEGLAAERRSALHLALAEFLEGQAESPAGATQIAHHRTMALPLGDRDRAVTALIDAAREATARTAFDEAAGHLRRAVGIAGGQSAAGPGVMCDYGDALRRAGDGEQARTVLLAAADRARATGDTAALAGAAFGLHRVTTRTESSRPDVVALLEEALAALSPQSPAGRPGMRWLLTASLARELADGPDRDLARAAAMAAAAVEGARADADRGALAYGLFALSDVRWEPGTAAQRLGIADEMADAASAAGETELLLEAQLSRLVALLELGDPAFAAQLDTFRLLAEDAATPRYLYLARSRQATLASLTGPFELADELIESAAAYGERIGEPDAWAVQASQLAGLAFLRHDWTRVSALAAARGRPLTPPEFAWHERAWLLAEAGEDEAAAAVVASQPDRQAAYRWRQAALLAADAELAAAVTDRRRCAALYEQLLPMAGEFAVVASAVFTTGPVALQLGLLAAALDRWDDAARHLEDAVSRCDRLGARLHADRARGELKRVRAAGGRAAPGQAAGQDGTGPHEFSREGDLWTIAFAGRRAQLRDVAVLLACPGREVAAADLAAGPAAASAAAALGADPVLDDRARAAYRARLAELDQELALADADQDIERSARLAAERDALIAELAHATGLGGRPRKLGDTAERARSTVTARIRDAIGRVERVHPQLGRHLRASVFTGTRCAYRPAETMRWHISQS